jgi:cytochrome c553
MIGGNFRRYSAASPGRAPGKRGWGAARAFLFAVAALGAQAVSAPEASAFQTYSVDGTTGNCANCHGDFNSGNYMSNTADDPVTWGTDLMSGHLSTYGLACSECHSPSGFSAGVYLNPLSDPAGDPVGLGCVGCHGRIEDATANDSIGTAPNNWGDGLRAHHASAGVTVCAGCHFNDSVQVGEDVPPETFVTFGIDACNEDSGDLTITGNYGNVGLDNDGDGLREPDDPDCLAGDLNNDGNVDRIDQRIFHGSLGSCVGDQSFVDETDYNLNGCTDFDDYITWFGFLPPPPPCVGCVPNERSLFP